MIARVTRIGYRIVARPYPTPLAGLAWVRRLRTASLPLVVNSTSSGSKGHETPSLTRS